MEPAVLNIVLAFCGGVIAILITLLGWIGSRVHSKLDELTATVANKFEQINETLGGIERDLRHDLSRLDRRVSRIEGSTVKCSEDD